jgi:hypothetical protein
MDEAFQLFFQLIECLSDKVGAEGPTLPRKRKAPKRYKFGVGEGYHSSTVSDHYRQSYFEAIDPGIKSRFDQPGYAIYQHLEGLLLKAANKEDYTSEFTENTEYPASKKITLVDILYFLRSFSEGQRTFFSQVCNIARLLILPSTNAISERSFS